MHHFRNKSGAGYDAPPESRTCSELKHYDVPWNLQRSGLLMTTTANLVSPTETATGSEMQGSGAAAATPFICVFLVNRAYVQSVMVAEQYNNFFWSVNVKR